MTSPDIRPLLASESTAYISLLRDSPLAFSSGVETDVSLDAAAVAKRLTEPGYAIIVAIAAGGSLVGAAGLYREKHAKLAHRARVWGMYVTPSARGAGIGRRMVARALNEARSWPGVTSVGLSCSERSLAAKRTYELLGFVAWGLEPAALVVEGRRYDEHHMVVFL